MATKKKTATADADAPDTAQAVNIPAPKMQRARFFIQGTAPLMTARFSKKAELMAKHAAGSVSANRKKRDPKDFDAEAKGAAYRSPEGWYGFNAASLRNAMISACRLVNFKMTLAKLSVFVEADGYDEIEGTPLIKVNGEWQVSTMHTRNATGVIDIRARPMWPPGWTAAPVLRWDADQFTTTDIANLLMRVGMQVGIGEGRPDSKASAGLGYGLFDIKDGEG